MGLKADWPEAVRKLPDKTLTMSIPRRQGWYVVASILYSTIWAYLHRDRWIDLEIRSD